MDKKSGRVMMPPPQIYHDNLAQGAVDDAEEEEGIANFTRVYPQPLGGGAAGQDAPGSKKVRQKKWAHDTFMQCKECMANAGCNIYLCNDTKNGVVVSCHIAYHNHNHNKTFLPDKCVLG